MLSGIEELNQYKKQETNQEIVRILKAKIDECLKSASLMKQKMEQMKT